MSILLDDHSHVVVSQRHGSWGFMPMNPHLEHPDDRRWRSFWDDSSCEETWSKYMTVISNIYDEGVSLEDVEAKVREYNDGRVDEYED